ncbi:MAG: hypothetical protein RLZZ546_94, partial [Bacteroidota bacterium]
MKSRRISLFEEYSEEKLNNVINTFKIKDTLNPKIWDDNEHLISKVCDRLLEIANDVYEELELSFPYEDVTLTG